MSVNHLLVRAITVQARIAKFGPKMQQTLVKVPIVFVFFFFFFGGGGGGGGGGGAIDLDLQGQI